MVCRLHLSPQIAKTDNPPEFGLAPLLSQSGYGLAPHSKKSWANIVHAELLRKNFSKGEAKQHDIPE